MHLTIVAATGGIGRQLLEQALTAGHDVTAVVAQSQPSITAGARVVQTDLAHPDVGRTRERRQGRGRRPIRPRCRAAKAEAGVAWRGTQALVDAARATDVRRIVVVSAAPIGTVPSPDRPDAPRHDPGDGFFMRHLGATFAKTAFRIHYADLARMEDVIRGSGLDWTISRPPKLTDRPLTGHYRTALGQNIRGGFSISRADVAHQMLHCLDQPETIRQTVGLAY